LLTRACRFTGGGRCPIVTGSGGLAARSSPGPCIESESEPEEGCDRPASQEAANTQDLRARLVRAPARWGPLSRRDSRIACRSASELCPLAVGGRPGKRFQPQGRCRTLTNRSPAGDPDTNSSGLYLSRAGPSKAAGEAAAESPGTLPGGFNDSCKSWATARHRLTKLSSAHERFLPWR